jgi:hypothetical protein
MNRLTQEPDDDGPGVMMDECMLRELLKAAAARLKSCRIGETAMAVASELLERSPDLPIAPSSQSIDAVLQAVERVGVVVPDVEIIRLATTMTVASGLVATAEANMLRAAAGSN